MSRQAGGDFETPNGITLLEPGHRRILRIEISSVALAEQDSPPMPPLNATLWMLLIASLVALFGWGVVRLTGRIERQRRTHGMTKDSR
jgi:hypothetical protein